MGRSLQSDGLEKYYTDRLCNDKGLRHLGLQLDSCLLRVQRGWQHDEGVGQRQQRVDPRGALPEVSLQEVRHPTGSEPSATGNRSRAEDTPHVFNEKKCLQDKTQPTNIKISDLE